MKLRHLIKSVKQKGKETGAKLLRKHYLDALFDSFKKKDMTRRGFKRAYHRIMDPKRMAEDAENLALHNQVRRSLRRV